MPQLSCCCFSEAPCPDLSWFWSWFLSSKCVAFPTVGWKWKIYSHKLDEQVVSVSTRYELYHWDLLKDFYFGDFYMENIYLEILTWRLSLCAYYIVCLLSGGTYIPCLRQIGQAVCIMLRTSGRADANTNFILYLSVINDHGSH